MNSEKDESAGKREDGFMTDSNITSRIVSMLSSDQEDSFYKWEDSNSIRNLKVKETSTMIYIEGEGYLQGVHIGTLSIQFVNSKNMEKKYKARIADGFVKFVSEMVDEEHKSERI